MNKKRLFIIGSLAFVAFLIANIPAQMVHRQVESELSGLGIDVKDVSGSIWKGQARIFLSKQDSGGILSWGVNAWQLFVATADIDFSVVGEGFDVVGGFSASPMGVGARVEKATITAQKINTALSARGVKISEPLVIDSIDFNISNKTINNSSGEVVWQGGDIEYSFRGKSNVLTSPPLIGKFIEIEDGQAFVVTALDSEEHLLDFALVDDGYAKFRVFGRAAVLLDVPKLVVEEPEVALFEVKRELL